MEVVAVAIAVPDPSIFVVDYEFDRIPPSLFANFLGRFGLCVMNRTCPLGAFRSRCPFVLVRNKMDVLFLAHLRLPCDFRVPTVLPKPVPAPPRSAFLKDTFVAQSFLSMPHRSGLTPFDNVLQS